MVWNDGVDRGWPRICGSYMTTLVLQFCAGARRVSAFPGSFLSQAWDHSQVTGQKKSRCGSGEGRALIPRATSSSTNV